MPSAAARREDHEHDAQHPSTRTAAVEALHSATAIYTREAVVEQVLDRLAWPYAPGLLADPSCGDGAFLLAALERLDRIIPCNDVAGVASRLRGFEIHPGAAQRARTRIAERLRDARWDAHAAQAAAERIVVTDDFLTRAHDEQFSWLAGNPPYLRMVACPELLREEYNHALPAFARADLLHAFLARCTQTLAPRGEIVLVTSDRWTSADSAAGLREHVGERLTVAHLERLDAASAFHRPKARRAGTPARVHPILVHLAASPTGTRLTRDALYPDAWEEPDYDGPTLGSQATVRLAPWLGPQGVFVLDEAQAAVFPREVLVPAVDTDDVREGILRAPRRYALRTAPGVEPDPAVRAHLAANVHRLPPRARRTPFWLPAETWHRMDLSQEVLLIPRIARSLRPIRLPAGILAINHNLTLAAAGHADLDAIERVLTSRAANEWIRARADRLEDGYMSVTTRLLRKLPWDVDAA
jgi:hypothetical protein